MEHDGEGKFQCNSNGLRVVKTKTERGSTVQIYLG